MKLIIAGGRDMNISEHLVSYLVGEFLKGADRKIDEVVSGACGIMNENDPKAFDYAKGVDGAGERFAWQHGIPRKRFYADFNKLGPKAGPMRNREMANYGDRLLVVWDGESRGSSGMRKEMLLLSKPVYEVTLRRFNVQVSGAPEAQGGPF